MVDVTDRHFRQLLRIMSKRCLLYTPMFVARRLALRKNREVASMLRFDANEKPVAAQLGGDDPDIIVKAALRCEKAGYSEVNLNLGCPARNAQAGNHGAMLMRPENHKQTVSVLKAMTSELQVPVSAKVRIGVDEHDSYQFFRDFIQNLHENAGVNRFVVHARKALLDGLTTTRQNRVDEIVPLRYNFPYQLKKEFPHLHIEINGGINTYHGVMEHVYGGMDGVMMGRIARDNPFFFAAIDSVVFGDQDAFAQLTPFEARVKVLEQYAEYCNQEQREVEVSREMLLRPINQIFEGLPEKQTFASAIRNVPKARRAPLMGDEILEALSSIHKTSNGLNKAPTQGSRQGPALSGRAKPQILSGTRRKHSQQ